MLNALLMASMLVTSPATELQISLEPAKEPSIWQEQDTELLAELPGANSFPKLEFTLAQSGDQVIPAPRGFIINAHEHWDIVLQTGRMVTNNQSQQIAELPFALREKNANCIHNGVLELNLEEQQASFTIAHETCAYLKFNAEGSLNMQVSEQSISTTNRSSETLTTSPIAAAPWQPTPPQQNDITTYGVFANGEHFQGPCPGRNNNYAYCDNMAVPAYSLSKSLVAATAFMVLEQQYPGRIASAKIGAYVPECSGKSWQQVTFADALNMTTGHYRSKQHHADESHPMTVHDFFLVDDHESKLAHACSYAKQDDPGETFVYHSSDTYLLVTALQNWLNQHADGIALDTLLYEKIWQPLALSSVAYSIDYTKDDRKQVWGGYGLTLTPADLVKLSRFIWLQHGMINGEQVLQPQLVAQAVGEHERSVAVPGHNNLRYQLGFWHWQRPENPEQWLTFMSGYGGIAVVLLPDESFYYLFSDGHDHRFAEALENWFHQNQ